MRLHEKKTDFAEIYVGEEFIATLNRVDEDGELLGVKSLAEKAREIRVIVFE
ncbi:MAG: DUF3126 family protein [Pseudomonadota bacterium]